MELIFEKAVKALAARNLTVTFAESCTGGTFAKSITDVPGASSVFRGSIVTYSNEIKEKTVFVDPETIKKYTEVSHKTAKEMAAGAAKVFCADIAVSATGFAGPGGGNENDPVGTVYVGVCSFGSVCSYKLYYPGKTREQIRELVTLFAAYTVECEASRA